MKVTVEFIKNALSQLHGIYYGGYELKKESILEKSESWYSLLKGIDLEVFKISCQSLSKSSDKMPNARQVYAKCMEIKKYLDEKKENNSNLNINFNDYICFHDDYFEKMGFLQSAEEKMMCFLKSPKIVKDSIDRGGDQTIKVLMRELAFCKSHYGVNLCPWHQSLAFAKKNPNSACALNLEEMSSRVYGTFQSKDQVKIVDIPHFKRIKAHEIDAPIETQAELFAC